MDRGAWRATGHGVAKSQTRLSAAQRTLNPTRSQTAPCSGSSVSGKRAPTAQTKSVRALLIPFILPGPGR